MTNDTRLNWYSIDGRPKPIADCSRDELLEVIQSLWSHIVTLQEADSLRAEATSRLSGEYEALRQGVNR